MGPFCFSRQFLAFGAGCALYYSAYVDSAFYPPRDNKMTITFRAAINGDSGQGGTVVLTNSITDLFSWRSLYLMVVGWSTLSLHSSNEPGELSQ